MTIKKTTQKIVTGAAGVALASTGCSCGIDDGAVDPAPPPLVCNDDVTQGQTLYETGTLSETTLTVEVWPGSVWAEWINAQVLDPQNLTVTEVRVPEAGTGSNLTLILELSEASVTSGSFTLQGQLKDLSGRGSPDPCDITRTFSFTISGTAVELAQLGRDPLPLGTRHRTAIAMVERNGRTVALEARTTYAGRCRVAWSVSGGVLESTEGQRACWRLPDKKGFYQAQVVTDFGDDGLAFDTINLEVV